MRILAITAASLMMTLPALAQNATNPQTQQNPATSSPQVQQNPSMSSPSSPQTQNSQSPTQNSQPESKISQQIKSNLERAGFKDIQMMPSSFIVRARDQNNNPVMMVISPDSMTAITQTGKTGSDDNTVGQGSGTRSNSDDRAR
jgi:protein required for attachment to host cells